MRKLILNNDNAIKDSGLFFGQGVFETILVRETPIFLEFHIKRLLKGAEIIGLKEVKEDLKKIILENCEKNMVLKISLTQENIIISKREIPYKEEDYKNGFKLLISKVNRNSTSMLPKIKSFNYLENLLQKNKAVKEGFNDVLFFNEKGNVCETSTGNIFLVKDGKIFTPETNEGLLNGAVRNFVIEEFNVEFKNFKENELKDIDEIFMTNSIIGIMKIKKINNYIFEKENVSTLVLEKYNEKLGGYNKK